MSTSGQRFQCPAGVFTRETANTNVCQFWTSLHIFRSDAKLSLLGKQIKRLDTQFLKNKHTYLIMTSSARLGNVLPSLKMVRISHDVLQEMIEANSWKNYSKLFQSSEMNRVVWWIKTKTATFLKMSFLFLYRYCFVILPKFFWPN